MEKSKHSMLVGSGACKFAHNMGFVAEPNDNLMTEETRTAYEKYKLSSQSVDQAAHDTLCMYNKAPQLLLCTLACVCPNGKAFAQLNHSNSCVQQRAI